MMDNQKQIRDKLLNILKKQNVCCNGNECGKCDYDGDNCVEERLADTLIESGLIVPEGAVVLTNDEYDRLYTEEEYEKVYEQAETDILANMADGGTSCHWCRDKHEKIGYEKGRKETAEKFAEMLKAKFAYDIERCKAVDEICKEIIGDEQ